MLPSNSQCQTGADAQPKTMADAAKVRRGARRNRNKKKTKEPATAPPEGSFDEPGDGAAPPPPPSRTDAVLRIEELERENAAARKAEAEALAKIHELSQRAEGDASSLDEQLEKVTKAHQATVASLQSELEAARNSAAAPLQQELSRLQKALDDAETSKAKELAEASEQLEQVKRDAATRETELREAAHQDIMRERDLAEKATAQAPDAAAIRASLVEEFKGTKPVSEGPRRWRLTRRWRRGEGVSNITQ